MAQKPRVPSLDVLIAARIEQAQIAIADLYKSIAEIAEVVQQLDAQVAELLARPTYRPAPAGAPAASPARPGPRLLAGRWPLRDGNVYPTGTSDLLPMAPYEEGIALISPPAMT